MHVIPKALLSAGLLASICAAVTTQSASAAESTVRKTPRAYEQRLPAQAQPAAAIYSGPTVFTAPPVMNMTPGTSDLFTEKDAHWGPAHNGSPAQW